MMTATALLAAMTGAAFAQDEPAAASPASLADCTLAAEAPKMPDPKKASAEDRMATIAKIKEFQGELNEYRTCLTAISDNEALEVEVRQAALNEYNRTVEVETGMVEDWQKFNKKYQKANK